MNTVDAFKIEEVKCVTQMSRGRAARLDELQVQSGKRTNMASLERLTTLLNVIFKITKMPNK